MRRRNSSGQRLRSAAMLLRRKEEIFIVNGMWFTLLLWVKLDFEEQFEWLSWAAVMLPLWFNNILGIFCGYRRLKRLWENLEGLEYNWWPQASKNAFLLGIEVLAEEWVSVVFKAVILAFPPSVPWMVKFFPLWLGVLANLWLFFRRKPRIGVAVKPRYIFALMIAMKLDGLNHFPWHFQFAPLWFLLSVVFCCVLMFTVNVNQRRLSDFKRKAFMTAACTTLVVSVLVAVVLLELAKYLEHISIRFTTVASLAFVAQLCALAGVVSFGHFVHLDRLFQRQQEAAQELEEESRDIVLEFIRTPEDVFIRESANLFKKHVSSSSATVEPRMEDFQETKELCEEECIICCVEGANYILLECGHGNFCQVCCKEMAKRNFCPMCRQTISRVGKLSRKTLKQGDATFVILSQIAILGAAPVGAGSSVSTEESEDSNEEVVLPNIDQEVIHDGQLDEDEEEEAEEEAEEASYASQHSDGGRSSSRGPSSTARPSALGLEIV